jgi:methionine biosynthesis protein MetW
MTAALRPDLALIAAAVPAGARVLDVGCGDGSLLAHLRDVCGARPHGLELDAAQVARAVARGLPVVQGDADRDLSDWPDDAFDIAILSQTIQATRAPARVLAELARVARQAFVSLPNFGYWRVRLALALRGRMPETPTLPHRWHSTPNIHLCTLADFEALALEAGWEIARRWALAGGRRLDGPGHNWRAETGLYLLVRPGAGAGRLSRAA